MADLLRDKEVDLIIGPEARGFIIGAPLAYELGVGFVPARKKGNCRVRPFRLSMSWIWFRFNRNT